MISPKKQKEAANRHNEAYRASEQSKRLAALDSKKWWWQQRSPIDRFTGWLVAWTALLFIATCVNAIVLHWTDDKIGGQLDELRLQRLTTMAQLRANFRREQPSMNPVTGSSRTRAKIGDQISGWEVNPLLTNVGQTDATHVKAWFDIVIWPFPGINNGQLKIECPDIPSPDKISDESIVSKDGKLTLLSKFLSIEDVLAASGANPTKIIYIVGGIRFMDIFPETPVHGINWCTLLAPNDVSNSVFSFIKVWDRSIEDAK